MNSTIILKKVLLWIWVIFFITPSVFALSAESSFPNPDTQDGFMYENFQHQKYLTLNITSQRKNRAEDVRKLQTFFNTYEKESLAVTGIYDTATQEAVNRFQVKYVAHILAPWGLTKPTGNVGIMTRAKINNIVYGTPRKIDCPGFAHSIKIGQSSPDLPYLRRFLTQQGFYFTDQESYIYDDEVQEAVNRFQERYPNVFQWVKDSEGNWHISTKYSANLLVGCDAPEIVVR